MEIKPFYEGMIKKLLETSEKDMREIRQVLSLTARLRSQVCYFNQAFTLYRNPNIISIT